MKNIFGKQKEKLKIAIMAFLLLGSCFLTYYFHVLLKTGTVFTHLFYIPIIIASLWWERKGIVVALFLSGLLIFSHNVFRLEGAILNDYLRIPMFIIVSFAVALLSEQRTKYVVLLKVKESEERYRNLVENINDVIFNLDMEGNITYISPVIEKLFGYKPKEMVNRPFIEYVHPDDLNGLLKSMKQTVSGKLEPYEFRGFKKDGEIRHVRTSSRVQLEEGVPVGLTGVMTDITEQVQAEEVMRLSEDKYRNIVENASVAIFSVGPDRKFRFGNDFFTEWTGYNKDYIIGREIDFLVHPDDMLIALEAEKRGRAGEDYEFEMRVVTKDGILGWGSFVNRPIFNEDGTIAEIHCIVRNITGEKLAEEALNDSEERYRNIVEDINDVIFKLDMEGILTYISPAIERISGYHVEEIAGQSFARFVHPDDLPELQNIFEQDVADIEKSREFRVLDKDGEVRHVRTSSRMQLEEGVPIGITGVITDITERVRVEEALQEREAQLSTILSSSAVGIVYAENRKIKWANEAMTKMFGYDDLEDHIGKDARMLYPTDEEYERVGKAVYESLKDGRDGSTDAKFVRKDGSIFDGHVKISAPDPSKPIIGTIANVIDITERVRAEEALKEGEERYRNLVENINDVIFKLDMEGILTYISPAIERISGYHVEEIAGQSFARFVHPDDLPELQNIFEQDVADIEKSREFRVLDKDGEVRHVRTSSRMQLEEGVPIGITGVITDITERVRVEEALKESEDNYKNLVKNIDDIIYLVDEKGKIKFINDSFERTTGYKTGELVDKNFTDIIVPESYKYAAEIFKRQLAGEDVGVFELSFYNKKGQIRVLAIREKLTWEGNRIVEMQGIGRDITDRKQAEEALRESEERWRTLFETSRDVVYISTIDGRHIDINPAGEELFGYTRNELLELDIIKDIYKDPKEREKLQKVLEKEGFIKDYETDFVKKDGVIINALLTATVRRDRKGNIIGYHGIIRDITEKKKMEKQFIQTEKLSSLGGILSGVAHELNNPLTSIIGNAQLLARKNISDEINNKLEVIQKESMRCTKIVGGLLTFAREHKPERRRISVNDVIMESCKLRKYEMKVDNVSMELDLSDNIPVTSADPYQLQQVFINLINNAHDALKEKSGGVLNIKSYRRDETILIEFEDNGPGIPKKNINRIFDPFFTTKEVGEGTGLGLSIIYGIVNEHGGKTYVESEIDKGAKFTIELPIEKEVAEIDEIEMERPKKPEGAISVLVVEDEDSLREFISETLSSEGYVVETAGSGEKAVELLKKGEFDIIISDMKMPGMSGQNLHALVQKEYPELADKMLFITGDVLGKETKNFLKITGAEYIEKPFVIDELLYKLNDLLSD